MHLRNLIFLYHQQFLYNLLNLGEKIEDPVSFMLIDFNTVTANLTGKPAISVPYEISSGLPIGIQIMANSFEENKLFQAAYALEKTVDLPEVPL